MTDGQSGLAGHYATFGDPTPTARAGSVVSDTETRAGADIPAAPYYVRARDNVGHWAVEGPHTFRVRARDGAYNESAWSAETATVVDVTPPAADLDSITEASPYVHVSGDTIYYGPGSGAFTVTITADDALAGLDRVVFPATVSAGGVYTAAGPQYAHPYTFTLSSTAEGVYQVAVYDRAGNDAAVPFTVTRDYVAPVAGVSVPAKVSTDTFTVTWSATDDDSGVAVYDVQVKVDDGDWTSWLTATTATEAVYSGELGHLYTFRVRATDNVSNTGPWSAEASTTVVQVTKYYTFGGRRIAMRQGDVVYYIHADHLGSVSVVSDGSGALLAAQRYYPYGESRHTTGTLPTDFGFTGQRNEGTIGLYDYRARFYDPVLGRFVSADTVVPNPGNPQDLNRYAYVRNNPLRYTDPSGHIAESEAERAQEIIELLQRNYGVIIPVDWGWQPVPHPAPGKPGQIWIEGAWELAELEIVRQAVEDFSAKVGGAERFRALVGGSYVRRVHGKDFLRLSCEYVYPRIAPAALTTGRLVTLYDELFTGPRPEVGIVHELGHVWDWDTWALESLGGFVRDEPRPTNYAWTNVEEHWAETVAGWVYPNYTVQERQTRMVAGELGPLHQQYMVLAVSGQIPVPRWAELPTLINTEGGDSAVKDRRPISVRWRASPVAGRGPCGEQSSC